MRNRTIDTVAIRTSHHFAEFDVVEKRVEFNTPRKYLTDIYIAYLFRNRIGNRGCAVFPFFAVFGIPYHFAERYVAERVYKYIENNRRISPVEERRDKFIESNFVKFIIFRFYRIAPTTRPTAVVRAVRA